VHTAVPANAEQLVTARAAPSGFWVVGLGFAPVGQLEGAGWREGKGVGIGMLLYVEHPNCIRESSTDDPSKHQ